MHYRTSNKIKGFTLLELMVVLLIAGILLSYALPAYRDFGLRQKVSNESNSLLGDLMYARSTAIKDGQSVRVETVSASNDWTGGWTITLDTDNVLLRQHDSTNRGVTLTGTDSSIVFNNLGAASTINAITITHPEANKSVIINVSASGMVVSREL